MSATVGDRRDFYRRTKRPGVVASDMSDIRVAARLASGVKSGAGAVAVLSLISPNNASAGEIRIFR
jgi:hypothetical protein